MKPRQNVRQSANTSLMRRSTLAAIPRNASPIELIRRYRAKARARYRCERKCDKRCDGRILVRHGAEPDDEQGAIANLGTPIKKARQTGKKELAQQRPFAIGTAKR